jgi:hypothetical protein
MPDIMVSDWKPLERDTLRGFCTASLPSGLILHDVSVHLSNDTWWHPRPANRRSIATAKRSALRRGRSSMCPSSPSSRSRCGIWASCIPQQLCVCRIRVIPNVHDSV